MDRFAALYRGNVASRMLEAAQQIAEVITSQISNKFPMFLLSAAILDWNWWFLNLEPAEATSRQINAETIAFDI